MNTILPDYPRADPLPDDAAGATVPAADDDAIEPHARTLSEHAYHQLRQHIVEGHYPPGAKLRVEHLKNVYGVGAGTLREALTRLVSDALVVAEGQRGFRVTPMSVADLEAITRLRIHIEVDALRESVRSGDAAWEQRVRQSFEMLSAWEQPVSIEHRTAWEACNRRFHEALISAAATPWTYLILRMLSQQSERYRRVCIGLGDSKRDVHAEHTCLFEAAMRRADARAALALEDHIGATLAVVRNAPPDALPF
ncbi:MAG: GntR family transcriptional regulator [Burkholderia multivorans]|nr:GntR family transcriptional regulator [Burkholderia multivorans]MDI3302839.1 GntR family transcriptional regulator [Burkholderia multivorans]